MAEDKWFNSGRGIFCRDAGFQLATMPLTVNWQEDTARIVDLLNRGERAAAAASQSRVLYRDVNDMMNALRLVASTDTSIDTVRDIAKRALERLESIGVGDDRVDKWYGCLGCPMVDGKCPHCGNEEGPP